jgi:hypothetical protein
MEIYYAGKIVPQWKGLKEHCRLEYNGSGLILYLFYDSPTRNELTQFNSHNFQLTMLDFDGVGFFCYKFGNLPWADVPFSPAIYNPPRTLPEPPDDSGYALTLFLIDVVTGTLVGCRTVTMTHESSLAIHEWWQESLSLVTSRLHYDETVKWVYENYTTAQLVLLSKFRFEE